MYAKFFKRLLDAICSAILLLLLLPLFVLIWLLIRINMGSPAIFKQARVGKDEHIFYVMKFRSMTDEKDANGILLPDENRLTKMGKFLRKSSLDELPQLLNVLKGDMSFIGPRPLLPQYLPYYRGEEKLRHSVRSGISGLAQINGRNCISWDKKFAYDVEYAKNISFFGDLKIALITIKKVFFCEGVKASTTEIALDKEHGNQS